MEVVQNLATQKIRELLALCGISHRGDAPIQEHINCIANYVHTTRLEDGIEGFEDSIRPNNASAIHTPPSSPKELRGSYRFFSSNSKRSRDGFKGLTTPSKRKKRTNKKSKYLGESGEKPDANSSSAETGEKTKNQIGSTDQPLIETTADTAIPEKSTNSPVDGDKGNPQLTSEPSTCTRPAPSVDRPMPTLDTNTDCTHQLLPTDPLLRDALSHLPTLLCPAEAAKTMTSILWNCVKLNNTIGRYGRHTKQIWATTKVENMRQYLDDIAQHEYEEAVRIVKRDNAFSAGKDMQTRYNETVYWEIISKGAKLVDPATLPASKGPLDGFTMAEKAATKVFMLEAGFGTGTENQRRCRNLWKKLSEIRKAGVGKILLYRTNEFDTYCKRFANEAASLTDVVMSWEKVYGPLLEQLETRMMKLSAGDFTGVSDFLQPFVAERLGIKEASWNNAFNEWHFDEEAAAFGLVCNPTVTSDDPFWCISDQHIMSESGRNKSIFMFLFPRNDRYLSVCPIVPVNQGDILGLFAGTIRFSDDFDRLYGIRGPFEKLWLDYSQVTGTLNQMKVSQHSEEANVQLHWEPVKKQEDKATHVSWIVSVRALKAIMPFEEILREAPQKEQYLLHQSEKFARQGFTKSKANYGRNAL